MQVGENIAIPSNDYDDPFWIMLVTKCVHVLAECLTNGWDNQYKTRGIVICGYYHMIGYNKGVGLIFLEMTNQ